MSLWKFNDVELDVDMGDADFQEKYEDAVTKMGETEKELQKVGKLSEITRSYCDMFYKFFDNVFGPKTGERLFEGKHNTQLCETAYFSFIDHCAKEVEAINKRKAANFKKYKVRSKK